MPNFQFVTNQGDQAVRNDGTVLLDLYSLECNSPEGFDLEVFLHPFQEQLYIPSFLTKESNLSDLQVHAVGQEDKTHVMLTIIKLYSSQLFRILC